MTVCIAATARLPEDDSQCIVLCTDRRTSSALGSSETALKQRWLDKHWRILTAGTETDINSLFRAFYHGFHEEKIDAASVDAAIKNVLFARKRDMVDLYVRSRFGLSYDEFYNTGKEKLPPDMFMMQCVRSGQLT